MSDDDRMDRAERIRNMRAGNRGDDGADEADAESADDSSTDAPEPAESADDAVADADAESTDDADETVTDDAATGVDAEAASVETAADEASEQAAKTAAASTGDGDDDSAADATAAAERAAAAAAQITDDSDPAGVTTQRDVSATASPMQGPSGVELPDQQLLEEAMATSNAARSQGATRAAAVGEESTQKEELVRVLEFSLGDEYYCLDIEYVEEIVKRETVTRVPNTPDYVDGVVDLRGQITTILEPKEMMDIDEAGDQSLIVVFDPEMFEEQGAVGWVVDEVRQVVPVAESEVNDPPVDAEYINGVVDREDHDQFVIWVEPDDALAAATAEDD
ncbi:chemotaxis protein CheW [Haloarcula marina]|uniref:chemotaxis protein CheW n=1 Tax=Haloarcula marina TaxID=2961574 RepID=UPI0020B72E78|nr:chemotaxis protein CheW [Halomicroarcula marina]